MLLDTKHTTLEASRLLNAFVLFREEGMDAVQDTFPEYRDFVEQYKEYSVRQVKKLLFPNDPPQPAKAK
jgi:hypothetical protein